MPGIHTHTGRFSCGRHRNHRPAFVFGGHHRRHHHDRSPSPQRHRHRGPPGYNYGNLVNLFHYGPGNTVHDWDFHRLRLKDDKPKPDPSDKDVLSVESVDLLVSENTKKHHTDDFDMTQTPKSILVVRRGQPFNIQINFSRPYATDKDDLRLVFEIGDNPKPSKETHVEFILSKKDEEGKWGAKISSQTGNSLVITVFTPPNLFVGMWNFKVDVIKRKDNKTSIFRYNHKDAIYILFNPWCKEDAVFMEDDTQRQMYVLNDKGKIYAGTFKRISAKPWVFGQFEEDVLDCCMYLLDITGLNFTARGNPIPVVRKLSAVVNSQDEGGVLTGNWSGNYSEGKSPLSWTGSSAILQEYHKTKYAVRFGQCWVFSGVLTTVCRALGIPARSVTNFASAHDVDASITIDVHFDENGESLEELNEDSVWNFHVWNEVWMSRPDLPAGYGGWQAVDATPQETSDGFFCCGPASVRAIKEGEVNLPFDGPFIFAEVNADKIYWVQQKDGTNQNVHCQKNAVGKCISTMSRIGEREDVTKYYKYAEDSAEERVAVQRANQVGSNRRDFYVEGPKDVDFEMKFDPDSFVGDNFKVSLKCVNSSQEIRGVIGKITARTVFYTGVAASVVGSLPVSEVLNPGETKTLDLTVDFEDYNRDLKDCCMLSLSSLARVTETSQIFTDRNDARLRKPHVNIKGPTSCKIGEEVELEVSFTNPMKCTLTNCALEVEASGFYKTKPFPQKDVLGLGTFLGNIRVKPKKKGERQIVVIFSSSQLEDINGTHDISVNA